MTQQFKIEGGNGREPITFIPGVVLAVIGVLAAIHAAIWVLGENWQVWSIYALAFIPARLGGGEAIAQPQGAAVWSFVTYALLHADVYHLATNSIWLAIFSTPLARRLGAVRYLALMLVSAVAGAAAMLVTHWAEFIIVVGASASVSGALAAVIPIMFAPGFKFTDSGAESYTRLRVLRPLELLQNRNAIGFAAVFLVLTLITGVGMATSGTAYIEETSIAWEAHVGGFIAGLLLFYIFDKKAVPHF